MKNTVPFVVGEEVIHIGSRGERTVVAVDRVTKAQASVNGVMFWQKSGDRVGSHQAYSSPSCILHATPAELARARERVAKRSLHARLYKRLRDLGLDDLTTEQWQRVEAILDEPNP